MKITKEQIINVMQSLQSYINNGNVILFDKKMVYGVSFAESDIIRVDLSEDYSPCISFLNDKLFYKRHGVDITFENFNNFLDKFQIFTLTGAIDCVKEDFKASFA